MVCRLIWLWRVLNSLTVWLDVALSRQAFSSSSKMNNASFFACSPNKRPVSAVSSALADHRLASHIFNLAEFALPKCVLRMGSRLFSIVICITAGPGTATAGLFSAGLSWYVINIILGFGCNLSQKARMPFTWRAKAVLAERATLGEVIFVGNSPRTKNKVARRVLAK